MRTSGGKYAERDGGRKVINVGGWRVVNPDEPADGRVLLWLLARTVGIVLIMRLVEHVIGVRLRYRLEHREAS